MLKLHGFHRSNYYNIAKMALLEKGAEFEEVHAFPSQENSFLESSPMGKVPCLETPNGPLTETSAIVEYIDETHDGSSLLGDDPWQRAKVRELMREVELYVDLAVRPTFMEVFFGGEVSDEVKSTARKNFERGLAAISRRTAFEPYITGSSFSAADIMAFYCLPLAGMVSEKYWGIDPVAALPGAQEMMNAVAARPSARSIAAAMKT